MIEAGHRAAVRNETMISIAINALIPTAIIWAIGMTPPAALGGATGLWSDLWKASGIATLLMTLVVTWLVRGRVRSGAAPKLARGDLPPPLGMLPGAALLRAIVMAIVAVVILVPIGMITAQMLGILPLSVRGFVIFNLLFGSLVGLTMTPIVVLRALADPVRAA